MATLVALAALGFVVYKSERRRNALPRVLDPKERATAYGNRNVVATWQAWKRQTPQSSGGAAGNLGMYGRNVGDGTWHKRKAARKNPIAVDVSS